MRKQLSIGIVMCLGILSADADLSSAGETLAERTLVVWAAPDHLEQRGGSALTLDNMSDRFDGIVFGEIKRGTWMPGSEYYSRTAKNQDAWPVERHRPDEFVQIAIVYQNDSVAIYRNGEQVDRYPVEKIGDYPGFNAVLFGRRHFSAGGGDSFAGKIDDARIYAKALTPEEIDALAPNTPSKTEPYAWWDFEDGGLFDKTGRFDDVFLLGAVRVLNGKLVLPGNGATLIAFPHAMIDGPFGRYLADVFGKKREKISGEEILAQRRLRRVLLEDPIRPVWHLTIPEGKAGPFDPNGAIFKDGVYHLWYLYQAEAGHHWAHVSSIDLFHWRWHSNDLKHRPGDPDTGIFSGNAFTAGDGKVVMAYHGLGADGNCVAFSSDPELNVWNKSPANPIAHPGWDPHMWFENGRYYQISGSKPNAEDTAPTLFVGDDYKAPLTCIGKFMTGDLPGVDAFEDISCPDFFKLGDKHVLLCISHRRGVRYYIGRWDGNRFAPESHHRMNWPGGTFFAPETLLDDQGRRILWGWVLDAKSGITSGTMSMPRVLTLAGDGQSLNIAPPKEIELLRYRPVSRGKMEIGPGRSVRLEGVAGKAMELDVTIDPGTTRRFGIKVFCSADGREQTPIRIDRDRNILQVAMNSSGLEPVVYREFVMFSDEPKVDAQEAPFALKEGEKVRLRIFLDKSILEVFVNERQCMTQVVYPTLEDAVHVEAFAEDGPVTMESFRAWQLFPAMQW